MINNETKRIGIHSEDGDKNTVESEHTKMWDNPSILILFLDSMGLEIISDSGCLPLAGPLYVKCNIEIAHQLRKSLHFDVGLCGDNIWKISLTGMDHPLCDDPNMISWMVENRKEYPTRRGEAWLDMIIEESYVGSSKI
jgi:hypothetical protein